MRKSPIPQASGWIVEKVYPKKNSFVFYIRRMVIGGEKYRVLWTRQFNVAKLRKETRKMYELITQWLAPVQEDIKEVKCFQSNVQSL